MEQMMIRFKDVSFSYEKDELVLDDINLELFSGFTLLLGPNGSGKSTLLKLAAGVEKPDYGYVAIDKLDLWKDEISARKNLCYLPEHPDLTPYASLQEIINLVCRLRNESFKKGRAALKFFGLQKMAHRSVRELSMGQRRRAVFAAAIIGELKNILLDEPLEGMDLDIQREIIEWIYQRIKSEALIIAVSNFIKPFVHLVNQALVIKDGHVVHFKILPEDTRKKLALLEGLSQGKILEWD